MTGVQTCALPISPVARLTTIRVLLSLAASHGLLVHQMDVKTAFLNGELKEEIYMQQPDGFVIDGQERKVCRLIKSLYGLKQAPKQWHDKFNTTHLLASLLMKLTNVYTIAMVGAKELYCACMLMTY